MDPLECIGQTYMGVIKSYNPVKGYGFATSDKLEGDIFFLHKNLPYEIVGEAQYGRDLTAQEIAFTCDITPEGKPSASEIKLIEGGQGGGKWGKGKGKGEWKGKGKGKAQGKGAGKGPHNPVWPSSGASKGAEDWWDEFEAEPEYYEPKPAKGQGKGKAKGGNKGAAAVHAEEKAEKRDPPAKGTPLLNSKRVQATMKTYSHGSKWGFALVDKSVGNFGDIFVHLNNLDDSMHDMALHEGDIVEMRLERVEGKPVAKDITLVPQDPTWYDQVWMKGDIKSFNEGKGYGFISCPRVSGDIWFSRTEMPPSLALDPVDQRVLFKLAMGPDGKPKGKMVNYVGNENEDEAYERLVQVVQNLLADGYVDETAAETLTTTPCDELFSLLPDLEFYEADNPSSFILGALSRVRKNAQKGKSKGGGPSQSNDEKPTKGKGGKKGAAAGAWAEEYSVADKTPSWGSRPGIGYVKGKGKSAAAGAAASGKGVKGKGKARASPY